MDGLFKNKKKIMTPKNSKLKSRTFRCRICHTEEVITDKEYGIKLKDIKKVYCMLCGSKDRKISMDEVID